MFSAWSLFNTPKLIILAELTSPAANFNSHQPQIRAPGCNWLFFSDNQIVKIMEPSPELSLVPRELTDRALNIGDVNSFFSKANLSTKSLFRLSQRHIWQFQRQNRKAKESAINEKWKVKVGRENIKSRDAMEIGN